jgi:anti-sigma-K factor RskA
MSMPEHEVSDLLGAYALDAVEPDEARRIEEHLATCPKCRAEVAMYRETAAFLAYAGTDAPEGVWARIGAEIAGEPTHGAEPIPNLANARARRSIGWSRSRSFLAGIAAVAAAAVVVLGIDVSHLTGQVNALQQRSYGLAPLVVTALESPHKSVTLTSADSTTSGGSASVAITGNGSAYWLGSTLKTLPSDRTYQVWANNDGRIISLGLLGSSPRQLATFRVQSGTSELMVTNEPSGGTTAPTTPVVVSGMVPASI